MMYAQVNIKFTASMLPFESNNSVCLTKYLNFLNFHKTTETDTFGQKISLQYACFQFFISISNKNLSQLSVLLSNNVFTKYPPQMTLLS